MIFSGVNIPNLCMILCNQVLKKGTSFLSIMINRFFFFLCLQAKHWSLVWWKWWQYFYFIECWTQFFMFVVSVIYRAFLSGNMLSGLWFYNGFVQDSFLNLESDVSATAGYWRRRRTEQCLDGSICIFTIPELFLPIWGRI